VNTRSAVLVALAAVGSVGALSSAAAPAPADPRGGGVSSVAKLDPRLRPLLDAARLDSLVAWRMDVTDAGAPVLLELEGPADGAAIEALRARGVAVAEVDGRPVAWDRFVAARAGRGALDALEAMASVRRVRWVAPGHEVPALDVTTAMVELEGGRGARPELDLLTGRGVLFGSKDTNVDVFHPALFYADAGYYDWIDADGDGILSPGVDAIDLNGNGAADPGETAQLLRAEPTDFYGFVLPARAPGFDPGVDWLWLDEDGDGRRAHGAADGFGDDAPAFGEPLFVPDDFNRDGLVETGERAVRLGTSKIRKLYVNVANYYTDPITATDHVFVRGADLSANALEYDGWAAHSGYSNALHATAVTSILLGDVPLAGRRRVGMAPDAEIVVSYGGFAMEEGLLWLLAEHPDVVIHEYASLLWPLDGSGAAEALIDASTREDGVVHACAAGNWGATGDHAHVVAEAGQSVLLPLLLSASSPGPTSFLDLAVNIRGGAPAQVRLIEPDGRAHESDEPFAIHTLSNGGDIFFSDQTTDRGTRYVVVDLYGPSPLGPLSTGSWSVEIAPGTDGTMVVDAYLQYGVYYGVSWDPALVSAERTVASPGVADLCITAGAVAGHPLTGDEPWFDGDEPAGTVRDYSGRGPRIDGARKPDVVAPDNPWAAAPENVIVDLATRLDDGVRPHGAELVFGGTSGATPHVGGVAALLVEAGFRGVDVADALRASASPPAGGVPSVEYGSGLVSASAALGGEAEGERPTVDLRVVDRGATWAVLVPVVADADSDTAALEAKWDDDYDGTWDVPYRSVAPRRVSAAGRLTRPFKVRVRDAGGRFAEDVAWVGFESMYQPTVASVPAPGGCGCAVAVARRSRSQRAAVTLLALLGALAVQASRRRRLSASRRLALLLRPRLCVPCAGCPIGDVRLGLTRARTPERTR
jgi:hypothetical protein